MGEEQTPGGSAVLRHGEPRVGQEVIDDVPGARAIEEHMEKHLGPLAWVLHEIVSDAVHLDVHAIAPSETHPCWTLFTTGMSARRMRAPWAHRERAYAELLVSLPASWPLPDPAASAEPMHERVYWPIRGLKFLARMPHTYDTWLGPGHSVPNGNPARRLGPGTKMCCWLTVSPLQLPKDAQELVLPDGRRIHFYGVVPLHRAEMELKLKEGTEALLAKLDEADVDAVIDPARPSVVPRKLFGLF